MHQVNISSFIPFKLDLSGNYSKWRQLFLIPLFRYGVEDTSEPLHESAVWRNDDITIVLWIYDTISDELFDVIRSPSATAFRLWDAIRTFFHDNEAGRAIHIGAEFRSTVQGDLTVADYWHRLKTLSDALADVGEPVSDRSLTLQMIRGLSRRLQVIATILPLQLPFPTFVQARSHLLLEEIALTERERTEGSSALAVGNLSGGSSAGNRGPPPPPPPSGKSKGPAQPGDSNNRGNNNRGRGRGRGRGWGNFFNAPNFNAGRGQPGQTPWMGYFSPWGSTFPPPQPWRAPWTAPNAAGVLGARPSAPHQAYQIGTSPSSWDQYSMMNAAMSNLSMKQPTPEWFMDSGATSHVTGNAGHSHGETSHALQ